jgi:hypothetical protein
MAGDVAIDSRKQIPAALIYIWSQLNKDFIESRNANVTLVPSMFIFGK